MTEYYWTDEDARYTPSQNKNNPWSVRYISSKCEGIKYFKTFDAAIEWIDATETNVDFLF